MYQKLGVVRLKSSEEVEAGVVVGPDLTWSSRLQEMLVHKGDPWNWQNAQVLTHQLGLDVYFYILHRDGNPFTNIMTIERGGVGIFGHVWTAPDDRQQGASSQLMARQMAHFGAREGKALFLGTGYDSVPYHMYAKYGFRSIEAKSGYMAFYGAPYNADKIQFEHDYFALAEAAPQLEIQPLNWPHWPASAALFLGDSLSIVRCAPLQLIGRCSPEENFLLPLLRAEQQPHQTSRIMVLQHKATTATVGVAAWGWHPLWPDTCLVDIFCHDRYWAWGERLFATMQLPNAKSTMAYADRQDGAKQKVLLALGFKQTTTLPQRVSASLVDSQRVDLLVFEKPCNL